VGTAQGGLYRTTDGGTNWTAILDQGASLAIGAVAISPSNPTTVFVGTGEANSSLDSFFGVGVYRIDNADTNPAVAGPFSTDGVGNNLLSGLAISQLVVSATDPNTIWVSTKFGSSGVGGGFPAFIPNPGVFRSTNAASASVTFTSISVSPIAQFTWEGSDLAFEPGNPANLVCAVQGTDGTNTRGGIYRSTNANTANPTFLKEMNLPDQTNAKLAIDKVGSTVTVLAATQEDLGSTACPTGGLLRRSTDGGQTWSAPLASSSGFCKVQCWYNIGVAIAPDNANVLYIGGTSGGCGSTIEKSTDGGGTFTTGSGQVHTDTHAIAVAPSNSAFVYTGNDGGIYRSTDTGASWTSLNQNGFIATQFQSLALHPTDREFMIGGTQDNGTERRAANGTWVESRGGDGGFTLIDQNAADTTNVTMYHTFFNRTNTLIGFEVSTDAGNSWPNFFGCGGISNGIGCSDNTLFYAPMALGPGNPNTVYFGTDRLYRSTDKGVTMNVVSQAPISANVISSIGISPQNDNVRIVGLNSGKVFRTTTGSTTLNDVTGPIPGRYVARAVIDPNNANIAYVTLDGYGLATGQHVWKTANLSAATPTWTAAGTGIPDVPVNAFVVDSSNSNNLYAGSDIGVFRSTDAGGSWSVLGTGLPRVAVFDMAIENGNRVLRVATHGKGIWEISIAATQAPNYIGFVDHAGCDTISGWAADQSRLNTAINVEIYDGTTLISTVLASNSRPDVGALLGDNGLHGFSVATPASLKDGAAHNVHIKFETSATELSGSPAAMTCTPPPDYVGFVDHAGCDVISGWAADRNRLNTSINIEIYDGTTLISTVSASNSRPDVGAFLGDNGLHGFSVATPSSLKDGATHSVHVKFETSATELSNSPASINCSGSPNYIGFVDHAACDTIAGWAADRNRLNVAINVEVFDGTTLIAVVPAGNFRSDVGAFLGDNGKHGFVITTPASVMTGSLHTIHIKFETSSTELSGSPSSINCNALTPNYVGYADHVGCDVIAGWVADRNRLNTPITVSIYANNVLIATIQANTSRPDVGAFLGDNGLHGFSFPTPASLKGGVTSMINVRFEASGTDLFSNSPFTLTCP